MGFSYEDFLKEIETKSTKELKLNLMRQIYQYPKDALVRYELERRQTEEQRSLSDNMLKTTKGNTDSTSRLVKATWVLAIATIALVIVSLFKD